MRENATIDPESPMHFVRTIETPLGPVLLASDGSALTGLWFIDSITCGEGLDPAAEEAHLPVFDETEEWLRIYFSGRNPDFRPALFLVGTPFRMQVWELLSEIPYGRTVSYGQLAAILCERTGCARMSAQAVGNAVKHNPVSLIIPCHRVIGTDGSLTGYAAGTAKKQALLAFEHAAGRRE